MYQYTLTLMRPDTTVQWYVVPDSVQAHIQTQFRDTGKMTGENTTSEDLMIIREMSFVDKDTFFEFLFDPVISQMLAERKVYENANGIIRVKTEKTV